MTPEKPAAAICLRKIGRTRVGSVPLTEQITGTPFTAPRAANKRTWTYRIRPSVMHPPYEPMAQGHVRGTPFDEVVRHASRVLRRGDVMEGGPEMLRVVQVDAMFPDGTRLVTVRDPIGEDES
mgnify:CR=1 FL=1